MAGTHAKGDAAQRDETALQDTRQLLDELDALMDQMLALPIEDDRPIDGAAPVQSEQPPPAISATLTLVEPAGEPISSAEQPQAGAALRPGRFDLMAPASVSAGIAPELDRQEGPEEIAVTVLTDVAAPAPVQLLSPPPRIPTARWRPDHISYRFLLWANQGYDRLTIRFGMVGRLLRSRVGKAILGCAGLGLLGLALVWVGKDWLGWNW